MACFLMHSGCETPAQQTTNHLLYLHCHQNFTPMLLTEDWKVLIVLNVELKPNPLRIRSVQMMILPYRYLLAQICLLT